MHDATIQLSVTEPIVNGLQQVNGIRSQFDGSVVQGRYLVPGQFCGLTLTPEMNEHNFTYAYYISDLHLETWYRAYCKTVEAPASPAPISEWIETVMDSLFSGDLLQDIDNRRSFIVLFLGDITETFDGSKQFYTAFMRRWDEIDEKNRQLFEIREAEQLAQRRTARYEADVRIVENYKSSHSWTRRAKRPLIQYETVPDNVKAAIQRIEQWEQGDIEQWGWDNIERWERNDIEQRYGKIPFSREFHSHSHEFRPSPRNVFAVLGNHEIFTFADPFEFINIDPTDEAYELIGTGPIDEACKFIDTDRLDAAYEQGKQKYEDLFQSLGIRFLDNFGDGRYWVYKQGFRVAGFCGFSDPKLAPDVCGNYEIRLRDKLSSYYKKCVERAKSESCTLIFCTHFPLLHGTVDSVCKNNVYHFCGHTHRNELEFLSETGAIVADNQIGYGGKSRKKLAFERIGLYPLYNPFDSYEDGCHEVKVEDYQNFYWYCREQVKTGLIEKHLNGIGAFSKPLGDTGKLYMIKRRGYYGFFIAFNKIERVYICNGGRLKPVPDVKSIYDVLSQFDAMIDAYLLVFSGFRQYQEQIASYIMSFGGRGKIHGLIVDIDFFNHVGVNPFSGDITFYYSPRFGVMQSYSDMGTLLENHAPQLYPSYMQLSATSPVPYYSHDSTTESELVSVERGGNSFYGASRYVSPVQRLFSRNILRVWDENVLSKAKNRLTGRSTENIPQFNDIEHEEN